MIMRSGLIVMICVLASVAVQAQQPAAIKYRYPSPAEMQNACSKTHGQWRVLPPYCDNMHPRSWRKLTPEQQQYCQSTFNNPCDCGSGRRFSVVNVLGCVKSNFSE